MRDQRQRRGHVGVTGEAPLPRNPALSERLGACDRRVQEGVDRVEFGHRVRQRSERQRPSTAIRKLADRRVESSGLGLGGLKGDAARKRRHAPKGREAPPCGGELARQGLV